MYQTFYVDADEEVNSIIGRIRKSSAKYNILVITQRALIMQSVVSLKLIKREADKSDKKIIIVTKDERAEGVARKIGFIVKNSLEDLKGVIGEPSYSIKQGQGPILDKNEQAPNLKKENNEILNKRMRLNNLGSESFFSESKAMNQGSGDDKREIHARVEDALSEENIKIANKTKNGFSTEEESAYDDLFLSQPKSENKIKERSNVKGDLKFLWVFIFTILILLLGIGAYFYLPEAQVNIFPKQEEQAFNLKLEIAENGNAGMNGADTINLKSIIIEDENVLSLSFPATGQKGSSSQKAKGKIMIYNEFSETSQVLVATTRFATNDEKIFRLINSVTVPGMTIKDGKNEPGMIEAEIIADEAGESFNIKEAEFKIVGFKGSDKYDKFYAKLTQETRGGGGDEDVNKLKTVSGSDIESAKIKVESQLKNQLKESIKNKLGADNILLDDALSFEVMDYSVFPQEDSVTENFEYQVKIKIKALSFSNKELDEKINSFIRNKLAQQNITMDIISVNKEYGRADIDFGKKTIKTELRIKVNSKADIDADRIAEYLVNKNKSEINEVLEDFPEIKKIEATINPNFISNKFPGYQSRIKVRIQDTEE